MSGLIVGGVIAVVVLAFLYNAIKIVREYQRVVVFRLGRSIGLKGPGFVLIIPIVDKVVCVNPALTGGNGSGLLPGPNCPSNFRWTEQYVQGTEPTIDDRNVYQGGCYKINVPFSDWAGDIAKWAGAANAGQYSYGRFNWNICGYAAKPSGSPSGSPNPNPSPTPPGPPGPQPTPKPTTPPSTKKP